MDSLQELNHETVRLLPLLSQPPHPEHTFVNWQIRLFLAQDIVFLLLLHVGPLIVGLVQDELVGTCATGESISPLRALVVRRRSCDGEAVAAIWADCHPWSMWFHGEKKTCLHVGGMTNGAH